MWMNSFKYSLERRAFLCTLLIVAFLLVAQQIYYCQLPAGRTNPTTNLFIESDDIRSIKQFIPWPDQPSEQQDRSVLIIFDIDNTIAEPAGTQLGSDQWFYAQVAEYKKQGITHEDAIDRTVEQFMNIQEGLTFKPVQPDTPAFIKELQDRKFTTIALTARSCFLIDRTIALLESIGVNFLHDATFKNNFSFCAPRPACYRNGIIFTGPNDKGTVLKNWLAREKYTPEKIVLIDDKMYNLENVGREMERIGIPFVGIRYNRLDKKIKNFCLQMYNTADMTNVAPAT